MYEPTTFGQGGKKEGNLKAEAILSRANFLILLKEKDRKREKEREQGKNGGEKFAHCENQAETKWA